ncbi:MAG: hypothetical protein ACOZAO_03270 [Patescibacteria group bacterium]
MNKKDVRTITGLAALLALALFMLNTVLNQMGPHASVDTGNMFWLQMKQADGGHTWIFEPQMMIDVFTNNMSIATGDMDEDIQLESTGWIDILLYSQSGITEYWVENANITDSTLTTEFAGSIITAMVGTNHVHDNGVIHLSIESISQEDSITVFAKDQRGRLYTRTFTGAEIALMSED